jgi:hypothetical protein
VHKGCVTTAILGIDVCPVNSCLDDYFLRIVAELDCTAIWWDTISLPTTPGIRKVEIDTMHYKYRDATHTVVHDNYLVNFEWAKDGSPCVALVLSSWFTRGWTALELHESKSVKVLFKGPDPQHPIIKDLDTDILAADPRYATRAYWIASSIIRRLHHPVGNTRDLLTILRPRATCRLEDRTTISGLLANLEPPNCPQCDEIPNDYTFKRINEHIKRHTTRMVLTKLGKVGCTSLIHGLKPMNDSGPFCWTPEAVHDMPVNSGGDLQVSIFGDGMLSVDRDGRAVGSWMYRGLTHDDAASNVVPMNASNQLAATRIREALQNWQNCLILRESWQDKGPALLAATVGKEYVDGSTITDCRYVGAVIVHHDANPWFGGYDARYAYGTVRFGNEKGRPDVRARDVVQLRDAPSTANVTAVPSYSQDQDSYEGDSEEISEDGEEDGWISSDSDGPRRPNNMFRY